MGMHTRLPCHIPDRWSRGANGIWPDLAFGFVHERSGNEITSEQMLKNKNARFTNITLNHKTKKTCVNMASQAWQKWVELKITYRVSMIDVWDWEITVRDWKITTWDLKITVWEIKIAIREWKTVMRDHNYQSRMKNCHVRFKLTVDNEKSLREKKITIRDYRLVFSEPARLNQSAERSV